LRELDIDVSAIKGRLNESNEELARKVESMISNMYFMDGIHKKKVIPIFAFDEATCLVKNEVGVNCLDSDDYVRSNGIGRHVLNTFLLIIGVLHTDKTFLWNCPFLFAGTNTKLGNFLPWKFNGDDDALSHGQSLFDPFILTDTWNINAREYNCDPTRITNWKTYVCSTL
jgi:hypothetical protein